VCVTLRYSNDSYGYEFWNEKFDFITYHYIPRSFDYVSNAYANFVLDWHLSHN
jgi:hypothetical protein